MILILKILIMIIRRVEVEFNKVVKIKFKMIKVGVSRMRIG